MASKPDERIVARDNDPAQRGNPHQLEDIEREGDGLMSRAERLNMIRNEWQQTALPNPPEIPGWHQFWASTTNSTDSIHRRQKLGYVLVKKSEHPNFKIEKANSADYGEYITCNEMILMKIPTEIYLDIMSVFHHEMPMEEEKSIREQLENRKEELNSRAGKEVIQNTGEGFSRLGEVRKARFEAK
jgi:hypothetical protein